MSCLTPSQKAKILENKRRALEKLKARNSPLKTEQRLHNSSNTQLFQNAETSGGSSRLPDFLATKGKVFNVPCHATLDSSTPAKAPLSRSPAKLNADNYSAKLAAKTPQQKTKASKIEVEMSIVSEIRFRCKATHNQTLSEIAKKITSATYDKSAYSWTFHIKDYKELLNYVSPLTEIPAKVISTLQKAHKVANELPPVDLQGIDENILKNLHPFQKRGVEFAVRKKGRVLIADDMGLGKTVQAIAVCSYYKQEWPVLVICPSSMKMSWKQHFVFWLPSSVTEDDINVVNTGKDSPSSHPINIISYDLASKLANAIQEKMFNIIVVDESHFLKSHSAARTKNILPLLRQAKRTLLLSGTPALSRPKELFTQLSALDRTLFPGGFQSFRLRYCDAKEAQFGWDDNGSSNVEELNAVLKSTIMIRRMKDEVLEELPEKQRQFIVLDPSTVKCSRELKESCHMFTQANQTNAKQSALLQFYQETSRTKVKGVCDYLSDVLLLGKKVIVFAHHIKMLDELQVFIEKKNIEMIRIDGGTKHRQSLVDEFTNNKQCLVALLSITAAGTGLNISVSSCVIFAELYWNPGQLIQAEDRAHRIGQKDSVSVTYLVAKDTADDFIWPIVQEKLKILTNLGMGTKQGLKGDTTSFQDKRQRKMDEFFNEIIEESSQAFIDDEITSSLDNSQFTPDEILLEASQEENNKTNEKLEHSYGVEEPSRKRRKR